MRQDFTSKRMAILKKADNTKHEQDVKKSKTLIILVGGIPTVQPS